MTLTDDKLRELDKQIVKIYKSKHGSKSNETAENKETQNANDSVEQKSANAYNAECIHVQGNTIYMGMNSATPEIGDVRVTYKQCDPGDVSVIAVVNGNTFSN